MTTVAKADRASARPDGVVPYDPEWPRHFQLITGAVERALAQVPHTVEHVGSTAVPGLTAKPIIDLFAVVDSRAAVADAIAALGRAGWAHEGECGVPGRECFVSRADLPYHHLYVVIRGNDQHRAQTQFRDTLRTQPEARARYAALSN